MVKSAFDTHKQTVIQFHGWLDEHNSEFNDAIKNAVLTKNDINVIVADWSKVAKGEYLIVKSQMPEVGKFIGEFLTNFTNTVNYPLSNFKLVGHSLGAHIAGIVGKQFNGNIPQIVGIDPAGPFINKNEGHHLAKTDAKFVHVIHASSGKAGMKAPMGHADFYPNGGASQPGCGIDLVGKCAHFRAFYLYAESLVNNEFYSQECSSYDEFEKHKCKGSVSLMGGLDVDKT